MIKKRSTLFIGIALIVIPYLGFPSAFRTTLIVLLGLVLIFLSIKINFPRKATKRVRKKEKVTDVFTENSPRFPEENMRNKENSIE